MKAMKPVAMTQEELLIVLDDIRARVAAGDSLEGSIQYLVRDEVGVADLDVSASYRIGNSGGQGGLRIVGFPEELAEQSDDTPWDLAAFAADLTEQLCANFAQGTLPMQQVLCLAEEVGEFVGAYRRYIGFARRTGPWAEVEAELADVAITAYVTARVLGIDLDAAWRAKADHILTRGWHDTEEKTP